MKTLLVNPPVLPDALTAASCFDGMFSTFLDGRVIRMFSIENLGIGYLASFLREKGYSVDTLDACLLELTLDETVQRMLAHDYAVVGITGPQAAFGEVCDLVGRVRQEGFRGRIVFGGGFATLNALRILNDVEGIDAIVRGDGEEPLLGLLQAVEKGQNWQGIPNIVSRKNGVITEGPQATLDCDRDAQPWPARDFIDVAMNKARTLGVYTSSGCGYGKCTFCSPGRISQEYLSCWCPRDLDCVAAEIEALWERYEPEWLSFVDPDFLGNCQEGQGRALKLFRRLRQRGVASNIVFSCRADEVNLPTFREFKRLGVGQVFVGFESFVDSRLKTYRKGTTRQDNMNALSMLQDLDIVVTPGHIMFDPYVTMDDLPQEVEAYRKMDFYSLTKLTKSLYVLPETPLWETLVADDLIHGDYRQYGYSTRDSRVQDLQGALGAVQSILRPVFLQKYRTLGGKLPESTELSAPVKDMHCSLFDQMYAAAQLPERDRRRDLADLVQQGTSRIASLLGTGPAIPEGTV